jgi:hypothetical protein
MCWEILRRYPTYIYTVIVFLLSVFYATAEEMKSSNSLIVTQLVKKFPAF